MVVEKVEEEHPGCLVSDRGSEALASDHVPSSGLVLQVSVIDELHLNFRGELLVKLALLRGFLANYSREGKERR